MFIPTNLDVADSARASFGPLYARLFDYTMEQSGGRSVVTEYAWSTSSCDPCPTPPLEQSDLATLGADVLGQGRPGFDQSYHVYNMTVTRMHTRYNRATLTEDLVFREAPAVQGGREFITDASGRPEQGARPSQWGGNQFQARYAIRHPWTGPVRCQHPRRGRWGGPPNGAAPPPVAARDLAEVARGGVTLSRVVRSPIPALTYSPSPVTPAASAPVSAPPTPPAPARRPRRPRAENDHPTHALGLFAGLAAMVGLAVFRRRKP